MKRILYITVALILGVIAGIRFGNTGHPQDDSPLVSFTNCSAEGAEQFFTCGMHQQVRLGQPGRCPACGMRLVENRLLPHQNPDLVSLSNGELLLANVRTQKAVPTIAARSKILLNGRVVPDESRVFEQVSYLPGRIEKLYVDKAGMFIRKGQPIASVYSKELVSVIEAFAFNQNTESIIRAARNNLASWNLDVSVLRQLDLKGDYRRPVDIYADFSGTVLRKKVSEGAALANLHMGQPTVLYEVADLSRVWVVLDAYEEDLPWIKEGLPAEFTTAAHPGKCFRAVVNFIAPSVDPISRTIAIRLDVDNKEGLLKPDMFVNACIIGSPKEAESGNEVVIPKTAVLWTGLRSVVYVRDPAYDVPAFRCREVVLSDSPAGEHYLIMEGLEAGEEIVINGALALDAEAQLSGKRSMMNLKPQPMAGSFAGRKVYKEKNK